MQPSRDDRVRPARQQKEPVMIRMFVTHATMKRPFSDLNQHDPHGVLVLDHTKALAVANLPEHAEKNPREMLQNAAIESGTSEITAIDCGAIDADAQVAPTPLGNMLKVGIGIFGVYI